MKRFRIEPFAAVVASTLLFLSPSFAADTQNDIRGGNDYYGVAVILIDHKTGDFGISFEDENTGRTRKVALKADPESVYVSNPQGLQLDFSEIQVGDQLNVFTEIDSQGRELAVDIYNNSRYE